MTSPSRSTFVPAARLLGWVDRFTSSHSGCAGISDTDDGVRLDMGDGAVALLKAPWPAHGRPGRGTGLIQRLASLAAQERTMGIVLVRRGGYGIGVASAGVLQTHKCGTKYVQSQKAAGGASQHRTARRRGSQGDALVTRAAEVAAEIFAVNTFEYLATGGDTALIEAVLSDPTLRAVAQRPRLSPLPVADPTVAVLSKAAADFASVRIQVTDGP